MITKEILSEIMFNLDVMHLCCVENDVFDEYDLEARYLIDRLTPNMSIKEIHETVVKVFYECFWEDCRTPEQLIGISHEIFKINGSPVT